MLCRGEVGYEKIFIFPDNGGHFIGFVTFVLFHLSKET